MKKLVEIVPTAALENIMFGAFNQQHKALVQHLNEMGVEPTDLDTETATDWTYGTVSWDGVIITLSAHWHHPEWVGIILYTIDQGWTLEVLERG